MPPEMVVDRVTSYGSDMWSLGCIISECLTGKPLFNSVNEWEIKDNIANFEILLPEIMDEDAKDLILKLMVKNPLERLGASYS